MSKLKYFDGTNWNEVNGQVTGDTLPIGSIIPFGGETAPSGWLLCWGQELSRASYPELYSVIGDAFGGDDGDLTFNLPDLRGRTIVGKNLADTDFDTIGKTGGSKHLQGHSHKYNIKTNSGSGEAGEYLLVANATGTAYLGAEGAIQNTGSGNAGNLQPYQVTNYIIKYKNAVGLVGNVLDSSSNSHTDSYSCDYINNAVLDKYSTTEKIIGTWIDGSTIYRKVVDLGVLPDTATKSVDHNISNLNFFVSITGIAIKSGVNNLPLPFVHETTPSNSIRIFGNDTQITIGCGNDRSTWNGYAILEYTKDE